MEDKISLRKTLIWIKKKTNTDPKNFYILFGSIFFISALISVAVDYFTPFTGVAMIFRALLVIPLTISIFSLGYSLSYTLYKQRVKIDPEWVSFRERFSPTWRRRIGIIFGAILVVISYASQQVVGYTLISSAILASIIGIFAFIRKTSTEQRMEKLGLPDIRDLEYQTLMEEMKKEQEEESSKARVKKSQKKYRRWGIKDEFYEEEVDVEEDEYGEIEVEVTEEVEERDEISK